MKMQMYTVFDSVAKIYQQPIMLLNDDVALRVMKNCVNNPEHNYHLNSIDYTLFKIGEFDDEFGIVEHEPSGLVKITRLDSLLIPIPTGEIN